MTNVTLQAKGTRQLLEHESDMDVVGERQWTAPNGGRTGEQIKTLMSLLSMSLCPA